MSSVPESFEPVHYYVPTPDGKKAKLVRTFSDEQIADFLKRAVEITEKVAPADDLRAATFQSALTMVGQLTAPQSSIAVPQLVPRPNNN